MTEKHRPEDSRARKPATTICSLCEAACGLQVEQGDTGVLKIRGNPRDPLSAGYICPKAVALAQLQNDPDRVREPLRRRGDTWEAISWQDAIGTVAQRIVQIQAEHGRDAVALYFGNPVSHNHGSLMALLPLQRALGSRNVFSSNSLDAMPRMLVSVLLYGNRAAQPVPDLERTRFLLMLGANPVVSNGSVMTAPGAAKRLKAIRSRGGKLVVLDPRWTETAALADQHWFIRPGTDALLLLAMVHVLFERGWVRLGELEGLVDGLDELRRAVADFSPEAVSGTVGIEASAIAALAGQFSVAPSAVCYGRLGTSAQEFGTLTTWAIDVLNILTGNMDCPGGAMLASPPADIVALLSRFGHEGGYGRWRSRVTQMQEILEELPVAAMLPEMETQGEGRVRALITLAGNPALSVPGSARVDKALASLEFMLSIDYYVNESSRHAHILLPPVTPLERDHHPLIEHLVAVHNVARYGTAPLPKPPGAREDWEIMVALIEAITKLRGRSKGYLGRFGRMLSQRITPRSLADLMLWAGPYRKSIGKIGQDGLDLGPLRSHLASDLRSRKRRINLVPELVIGDLPRLRQRLDREEPGLVLVSRRTLRSHNSWLHNLPMLVTGKPRCTLQMHPHDAASRGLTDGQMVRVKSRTGEIRVRLWITSEMMPGVVSMPFGWGHDRADTRMRVAREHAGANMNEVMDCELVDKPSGTLAVHGAAVVVEP
jgi:anaerobic selenocysteine-containing dehydrogenase